MLGAIKSYVVQQITEIPPSPPFTKGGIRTLAHSGKSAHLFPPFTKGGYKNASPFWKIGAFVLPFLKGGL